MPGGPGNATSVVSSRAAGPADPARRGGGPHGSTWAAVPLPSPLAPPLPRQPEAERSSEGPLLSSKGHTRAPGAAQGREDLLLAGGLQPSAHTVRAWRGLAQSGEGRPKPAWPDRAASPECTAGRIPSVCKAGCAAGA